MAEKVRGRTFGRRRRGHVVSALLRDGANPEVILLAAEAVPEEVRHSQICHAVAMRYLGKDVPPPKARKIDEPVFGDAPADVCRLLGVVLHACINETLATVCLKQGLQEARSETVKLATRQLLEDDLNHARLGWADLASAHVSAPHKEHVAAALPTLLRMGRDGWLYEPRDDFDEPAHGVLGSAGFPPLLATAISELILPGFDYVGVDTRAARAWYAREMPLT